MSIRVSPAHFSGTSKVFGRDPDHLAAIVRGLAVDMTQVKIDAADVGSFTDNSTGTAAATLVDLVVPTEPFDATAAGGAQLAGFDTAMGKVENALSVLAQKLNLVRGVLGLGAIGYDGTVAVAGTIAALDKTITAATGASVVSFATGSDRMASARLGLQRLVFAWNETMTGAGMPILANLAGSFAPVPLVIPAITAAEASADGADAVSKAAADAFFTAAADNVATLAAAFNGTTWLGQPMRVIAA